MHETAGFGITVAGGDSAPRAAASPPATPPDPPPPPAPSTAAPPASIAPIEHQEERARVNYLYARAMVGRVLGIPAVEGNVQGQPSYAV